MREREEGRCYAGGDLKIKVSPFHLLFFSFSSITIKIKQTLIDSQPLKCEVGIKPNLIFMVLYFIFRHQS